MRGSIVPTSAANLGRRDALHRLAGLTAVSATGLWTPGAFAEALTPTSSLAEGPFYPDRLPLDTDNDLLVINDSITPAVGEISHLHGTVRTKAGSPIRNAFVEIWQVDSSGAYLHSGSANQDKRDGNFQGYGRFLTDSTGRYYFRTIKPVAYPGRTPHIHVAVSLRGKRVLTTQALIAGHPQNEKDGLFRRIKKENIRNTLLVDFKAIAGSSLSEQDAVFDIVLGQTPSDAETSKSSNEARSIVHGVPKSERSRQR